MTSARCVSTDKSGQVDDVKQMQSFCDVFRMFTASPRYDRVQLYCLGNSYYDVLGSIPNKILTFRGSVHSVHDAK